MEIFIKTIFKGFFILIISGCSSAILKDRIAPGYSEAFLSINRAIFGYKSDFISLLVSIVNWFNRYKIYRLCSISTNNSAIGFSYTLGSMSISATMNKVDNVAHTSTSDLQSYEAGVSFSF